MKLWKALGVAGLAGVAATGVIIARNERRRAQLGPEEVRARLHQRLAEAQDEPESDAVCEEPGGRRAPAHRFATWLRGVRASRGRRRLSPPTD